MSEMYRDPVAQLLALGDPRQGGPGWLDYPALGLTAEHIPELVRMAHDEALDQADPESPEVWAPLHAWRALGQLRAESAVAPLLQLLDRIDDYDDDWAQGDLPRVFGMIGPAAIPGLRDFLADVDHGEWARVTAGEALVKVAEEFPESREAVVAVLTGQLERFAEQERVVNGFLVEALCTLKAVESAEVMERAFAAGMVDLSVLGDWEEAQILLGLLEERLTPAPNFIALEFGLPQSFGEPRIPSGRPPIARQSSRRADRQKKSKRKQAKASRKRNRKR